MSDSSIVNDTSTVENLIRGGIPTDEGVLVIASQGDKVVAGGWLIVEGDDNLGNGGPARYCAVISDAPAAVVVVCGVVSEIEVRSWWTLEDVEMPPWVPVMAAAHWNAARAEHAVADARHALAKHEDKLETIVDAAHSYADDNDLCSRFDEFMASQGLRPRSRDYDISVDVALRISVTQSGHDEDAACENVSKDQIASALYNVSQSWLVGAIQDYEIVGAEQI